MLVFAIFLACAGAVLSLFARLPVLVAVVILMVVALVCGTALSVLDVGMSESLPWSIIVAIVALQIGYGLGAVVRGILRPFFSDAHSKDSGLSAEAQKATARGSIDR